MIQLIKGVCKFFRNKRRKKLPLKNVLRIDLTTGEIELVYKPQLKAV